MTLQINAQGTGEIRFTKGRFTYWTWKKPWSAVENFSWGAARPPTARGP